jgi:hypothetical protein
MSKLAESPVVEPTLSAPDLCVKHEPADVFKSMQYAMLLALMVSGVLTVLLFDPMNSPGAGTLGLIAFSAVMTLFSALAEFAVLRVLVSSSRNGADTAVGAQ